MTAGLYHNQKIVVKRFSFTFSGVFGAASHSPRERTSPETPTKPVHLISLHGTPIFRNAAVCRVKLFQRSEPLIETNQFTTTCLLFSEANGILRMPQIGCQYRIYMGCEKGGAPNVVDAPWGLPYSFLRSLPEHAINGTGDPRGDALRANVGSEMRVTQPACLLAGRFSTADTRKPDGILRAKKRTCQSAFPESR